MKETSAVQAFELLNELVLDARETVTYRRLASALCLHVNRSKQLLQQFVDEHQKVSDLKVSILVCGSNDNGDARTLLCPREELENVRDSMKSVFYQHIYAVSLASAALEETAITNIQAGFDDLTQTIGIISSKYCVKLSQEEIENLKLNTYKTLTHNLSNARQVQTQKKEKIEPISIGKSEEKKIAGVEALSNDSDEVLKGKVESKDSITKAKDTKKVQSKTGNISNFFSKTNGNQANKKNIKVKEEQQETKFAEIAEKSPHKDANVIDISLGINGVNSKNVTSIKNTKEQPEKPKNKTHEGEEPKKSEEKVIKHTDVKMLSKKSKTVNVKNSKVDKKRKRVMKISDSEDSDKDDPFAEVSSMDVKVESDEDIIPPTPNADVVKITSGIVNPRKRRKIIDKTYTTPDGYMVTKKEEVLESCSEDETEIKENIMTNVKKEIVLEKKTPAVVKTKKKITSPQKGKQVSIMNFFKKK